MSHLCTFLPLSARLGRPVLVNGVSPASEGVDEDSRRLEPVDDWRRMSLGSDERARADRGVVEEPFLAEDDSLKVRLRVSAGSGDVEP